AMVWIYHGLVTWGDTARESYERTVGIITLAERYLAGARRPRAVTSETPISAARDRFLRVAPIVRGLLARPSGDEDRPCHHVILQPLISREVLDFVDSDGSRELALSPPLTCDHLIRTKPVPLWLENPPFGDDRAFRAAFAEAVRRFQADYDAYVARHAARMPQCVSKLDSMPRVLLLPGLGAICAGSDVRAAAIARDITAHTLAVKAQIAAMGDYAGMPEGDMFDMEYRGMQHAKLGNDAGRPLSRQVALVTGGAGAIGSAIVEILLEQGCHVALTDLPGDPLSCAREDMGGRYGQRFIAVPLDVTDPASVARGFQKVVGTWGGVDIVVVNAGLALVSSLEEMNVEAFRRLEQVNVEGTLLVLAEAARHFRRQNTGGDIVAISTKNVFAPGAGFGAYSATKSAAHQLARIAGLELAEIDVRVNMVSPDAVFSHKDRPSGLWKEVGPSRMAARGLDPQGLEDYYRQRNLLKARVRAEHVARAVLFFVTRQTPTTGATLPVDGGLPDSTPR
ncbi:MAG: SDR family NAD(P)-dependent oxidoreductase, partial [Acidobacteria bacterium]|nr:SDR family NAD(P)-dependent oxidoreductase [Acidobacteriota bacterium]